MNELGATALSCVGLAAALSAQNVIDFETIPGGAPSDGLSISTQFVSTAGVTFSLSDGSSPVLARVGLPRTAFQGYLAGADQPAPGVNSGQFFLTDDGVVSGPPLPLWIDYASPVRRAGGEIYDIDRTEEWRFEALDGNGVVLQTAILPPNNTLDGSSTAFGFDVGAPLIRRIVLTYSGNPGSGGGIGVAFDNFYYDSLPPSVGQSNTLGARLDVQDSVTANARGPFTAAVSSGGTLQLDWGGPPNQPYALFVAPTLAPTSFPLSCIGLADIGTPPTFSDTLLLFDGGAFPGSLIFVLDANGVASQTLSLPVLPIGSSIGVQGLVAQPPGGCPLALTAAFELVVQ